jgi:predicted RNA methylase
MLSPVEELRMPSDEWIKAPPDGRRVKFTYQELPDDGRFIAAQVEGNKVVYSIVLTDTRDSLGRGEVESQFEGELSKKQQPSQDTTQTVRPFSLRHRDV